MTKTIVAIIVYNRYENLKRWLECWAQCDQSDAELVVVHNHDKKVDRLKFEKLCVSHKIKYIPRQNVGMDIGAFKDVCENRLNGKFPDYDNLLWITDDTIPMSKDFVSRFTSKLSNNVAITCMEIAEEKKAPRHVRTTGFCITKPTASKLKFPDQITNKEHCYFFEHRGGDKTLLRQIELMGLDCEMIDELRLSPLWDTGNRAHLNRWEEHKQALHVTVLTKGSESNTVTITNPKDKVLFICPVYNTYPEILSSLLCQTHQNWELRLIHDGPNTTGLKELIDTINDKRITYIENKERFANWGHKIRQDELKRLNESDADFVVVTNADNHHVPTYCEYMLKGFDSKYVAVYCSDMVHSYKAWQVIPCKLQLGYLDCAGVMVRKEVAQEIGWRDIVSHSSDWGYFSDIIKKYGAHKFQVVKGCLLIHN